MSAVVLAALTLTSCGQVGIPAAQPAQPPPAAPTVTVTQPAPTKGTETSKSKPTTSITKQPDGEDSHGACSTQQLRVSFYPEDNSNVTPNSDQVNLQVTNISGFSCTVRGYGGLKLLDYYGTPQPTKLQRLEANPPVVSLNPGATAAMDLTWNIQTPCPDAYNPYYLQFTPPETAGVIKVPWNNGAVCRDHQFDARPFKLVN